MIDVFLLLGSNLGDKQGFLQQAITLIAGEIAPIVKRSSVYETAAWGKTDEPNYLNQVIKLRTDIAPRVLLEKILAIEHELGRKRTEKWGSRTIDIDILFYGDLVIEEPGLNIPHPQLHNRRFTLSPLEEIAPKLLHPVLHKNISELKSELKDNLNVKKL